MGPTSKSRYYHGTRPPRYTSFWPPSCTTQAKAPTTTAVNHLLSRQISKRQRQSIGGHQSTTVPPSIGPLFNVRQKPIATKASQIVGQPTSFWQVYLANILSSWIPLLHFASLCRCFCSSPLRRFATHRFPLRFALPLQLGLPPPKWPHSLCRHKVDSIQPAITEPSSVKKSGKASCRNATETWTWMESSSPFKWPHSSCNRIKSRFGRKSPWPTNLEKHLVDSAARDDTTDDPQISKLETRH